MKKTTKIAVGAAVLVAGVFAFIYVALDAFVKNTGRPPRKRRKS